MFFRPNYMCNIHKSIINHHCKVIDWNSIRFHNNEITYSGSLKCYMSANHIIKSKNTFFRYTETNYRLSAGLFILCNFLFCQTAAMIIINRGFSFSQLLSTAFLQFLFRTIAIISFPFI